MIRYIDEARHGSGTLKPSDIQPRAKHTTVSVPTSSRVMWGCRSITMLLPNPNIPVGTVYYEYETQDCRAPGFRVLALEIQIILLLKVSDLGLSLVNNGVRLYLNNV